MSALPPEADIRQREWHVRYVPLADITTQTMLAPKRATSLTICGTIVAKAETGAGRDSGGRMSESPREHFRVGPCGRRHGNLGGYGFARGAGIASGFRDQPCIDLHRHRHDGTGSEKRPARFIALVECAVWAALVYAILETSPTMQQGWSPLGYLIPAAILFGIGTYVNGACAFGAVGHFGNGDISFGFVFLGIFAVFYIESLFGLLPDQPPISASLPLGPVLLAIALLAILALRLGVSFRSDSNFRRLTLSMGAIGITFTILAVFAPQFSITTSVGSIVSIPVAGAVISVCMIGLSSSVSARFRKRRFMLKWPTIKSIVRTTLGGILMGLGALAHSRWERYAADDWFPYGGMAGRARLRAARCVACRTHRQIRFDGKILVMTVAHVAHRLQGLLRRRA